MKRYKVKFQNPETGKHEAIRSYDEHEMVMALTKLNRWLLAMAKGKHKLDMSELDKVPDCPLPSWKYTVYDRKKIAEV